MSCYSDDFVCSYMYVLRRYELEGTDKVIIKVMSIWSGYFLQCTMSVGAISNSICQFNANNHDKNGVSISPCQFSHSPSEVVKFVYRSHSVILSVRDRAIYRPSVRSRERFILVLAKVNPKLQSFFLMFLKTITAGYL